MLLSIDTFRRNSTPSDSPWVAIICEQGDKIENGRIGMGVTERAAVQSAINGFYASRQTAPRVVQPTEAERTVGPEPLFSATIPRGVRRSSEANEGVAPEHPADAWRRTTPIFTTPSGVMMALRNAILQEQAVILHYVDARGASTRRVIKPYKIEERRPGSGFAENYLIALDVEKDEPRTFRMSNIDRIEVH